MTSTNVFDFRDYRAYSIEALGGNRKRTGLRLKAAQAIGCQPTYLSQVLKGSADLSLEQALKFSEFLEHGADEREYFLLLVQRARAGTPALQAYFDAALHAIEQRRLLIKNRLKDKTALGPEDQAIYYGSWLYACAHVAVAIPALRTREAMARYLGLPLGAVGEALDFLESRGLIAREKDGGYGMGPTHLHLDDDSPHINKHHANWRIKAVQALDRKLRPSEMRYSAVVTISRKDALAIKERLMRALQDNVKLIAPSASEAAFVYAIDWFEVGSD